MRGSPKKRRNSISQALAAWMILLLMTGCSGTKEFERESPTALSVREFIYPYERTFRPSRYDDNLTIFQEHQQLQLSEFEIAEVFTVAPPETIPGFRVQVFLTQDIERAALVQDSVSQEIPENIVYLVYDSPYYKVRVGNFIERSTANLTLKKIVALGYQDAWIVPDNVLKNPPPKLPDTPIELQRSIPTDH